MLDLSRLLAAFMLLYLPPPTVCGQPGNKQVSLKKYAPAPGNAGNLTDGESFCQATAYYATAITFRLGPNELLSPYYLFDMLPKLNGSCRLRGDYVSQSQQIMRNGYLRDRDYRRTGNCAVKPDTSRYQFTDRYRINLSIVRKTRPGERPTPSEIWFLIKRRLDTGVPVIATLDADAAFRNLKAGTWRPVQSGKTFRHSVVVTGYDEVRKEVEVLSPFGKSWGRQGFAKIGFGQLGALSELYVVRKADDYLIRRTIARQEPRNPVSGTLHLRTFFIENDHSNPVFDKLGYVLRNDILEPHDRKPFGVGRQFQVVMDRLVAGSFIYAFSIGPDGKITMHRPQSHSLGNVKTIPYPARVAVRQQQIILPQPTTFGSRTIHRGFHKSRPGTDHLIILHSAREISDRVLLDMLKSLRTGPEASPLRIQLKGHFGARMISEASLNSRAGALTYSARSRSGDILPLIIRIP